ncbi:MAG: NAD(P)H-dependent oxidoreductase [Endomicrobium sp.]|jgi:chromate reductase|nr:NAD(P)H-dependent oxidoreductase [Endomicrobium sp.]
MKIFVIIGGISKESINRKLFEFVKSLAPSDFEFDTFDISQLPFFSQDLENNVPQNITDFRQKVINSDAVMFITPEYNRTIPGVLKNAIDWGSRPMSKSIWKNKPACVLGASLGSIGAFAAQMHLKETISSLEMRVMYRPEVCFNFSAYVDKNGQLIDSAKKFLIDFLNSFKDWVLKNK